MFQSLLQADIPLLTADDTDGPLSLCLSHQPSSSLLVIDATTWKQHISLCNCGFCFYFFKNFTEYFRRKLIVFSLIVGLSGLWAISRVRGISHLNLSSTSFWNRTFFSVGNPFHRRPTRPFPIHVTQNWPIPVSYALGHCDWYGSHDPNEAKSGLLWIFSDVATRKGHVFSLGLLGWEDFSQAAGSYWPMACLQHRWSLIALFALWIKPCLKPLQ